MNLTEYPDADMMAIDLANILAAELAAALQHEERICFAVPGGTTPGPIFDDLCAADLDWSRVDVLLTDERWVAEDDPRSNTRLVKDRLLVNRAANARLLPLFTPAHRPEEVLAELESMIAPELPIAVMLLGMGADMHTASLFPGADQLAAALDPQAPILCPITAPDNQELRITLSARVLKSALRKHIVITGQNKRDALQKARNLPVAQAPVHAVLNSATIHWAP